MVQNKNWFSSTKQVSLNKAIQTIPSPDPRPVWVIKLNHNGTLGTHLHWKLELEQTVWGKLGDYRNLLQNIKYFMLE